MAKLLYNTVRAGKVQLWKDLLGNDLLRKDLLWRELLWRDQRGQDMIEYALLAAAIAVVVAGFLPQTLMPSVSTIFSRVVSSFAATP